MPNIEKARMTRTVNGEQRILLVKTDAERITDGFGSLTPGLVSKIRLARPVPPNFFYRPSLFTTNKTSVTIPAGTSFVVNGVKYEVSSDTTLSLDSHVTVANRKGKDVYIYGVTSATTAPTFVISLNSTYPTGYNAENSRKLGGFHCLCADVGTIADHPLSGYVAGDILPTSRWDLWHRPNSGPEGMVYHEGLDKWVDIYLFSVGSTSAKTLASVFGATIADGASTPKFHWYKMVYWAENSGKRLLTQPEFMSIAAGSNVQTNIKGSADPGTTGGHLDTANRRMISWIGCEDCCGVMWQWGAEGGGPNSGTSWANAYDENSDSEMRGQHYVVPNRPILGNSYVENCGVFSGPTATHNMDHTKPLLLSGTASGRGISDPKRVPKHCA